MEIKVIKNVDINELDFSVRTWNCLRRAKIDTVQDIADNYHNLNRVRNLGIRCIAEINEKIKPYVEFVDKVRITNYDRIRNMSIDEMAEFMRKMLDCVSCQNKMMNNNNPLGKGKCNDTDYYKMCDGDYNKCIAVCKKWLESEVVKD